MSEGRRLGASAVLLWLLLTACTSPASTERSAGPSTAATTATPSPSSERSAAEREAESPDPNFDFGFTVQITADGFHPYQLVALCCQAITWKNLTDATQTVAFDHLLVTSGPIPPGGTWVFVPKNVESISYHAGTKPSMRGVVQVNQSFES